jgi:hypothetical protein
MRQYKREVLEQINLHNPDTLRRVRDSSGNDLARVAATRQLELMGDRMDDATPGRGSPRSPGMTIIIKAAPGLQAQVIADRGAAG